jgi:hypothetical protein
MKALRTVGWSVLAGAAALPAWALDPAQVFEQLSPSVWIVRVYDAAERFIGQGSAVVIDKGKLVTNCHVLAKGKTANVRRKNVMYEAKLEHADPARDLCILEVADFNAPVVQLRSVTELRVGERVYAIGNPKGYEVTLSEGLVSGLRDEWRDKPTDINVIQTSAPISHGSSGGGLFDAEGRLIGITTSGRMDAQNINFAVPADWISEVPARSRVALAKRAAPAAGSASPPGYPAPGTVWVYRFTERAYGERVTDVTVRADRVDAEFIEETVFRKGGSSVSRRTVPAREPRFFEYPVRSEASLLELAPYLVAAYEGKAPPDGITPIGYPHAPGDIQSGWIMTTYPGDWEDVTVPAGTYRALRYEAQGARERPPLVGVRSYTLKFRVTVWYSPDIKRIVKLQHQTWGSAAAPHGDDSIELVEYRPPS